MRIDAHAHIFSLRTVLSQEAVRVITQRLTDLGSPDFLTEAVERLLDELVRRPQYLDEPGLLRKLIENLTHVDSFNDLITRHLSNDLVAVQVRGDLGDLPAEALSNILTKVANAHAGGGKAGVILNVIESLRVAMKGTITEVADEILEGTGEDEVIVALMLDIFGAGETDHDRRVYQDQIAGTAEAALQRPGRILPFFGVHPDRPGHLDELKKAVEQKGYVGVKLYPSLGYSVDSGAMRLVYQYCMEASLPVLLHCGHGGFYRTKEKIDLCDPAQWSEVLADPQFKGLKVCFAHFGGWEALGKRHCLGENWPANEDPKLNWGKKIYDFMLKYPNVYTDLAKHVGMFDGGADERTYFDTMRELMADPRIGKRILYGTDAWLQRLDMPFEQYRQKWRDGAGNAMGDIMGPGPRAFLGFPEAEDAPLAPNLERFVDYVRSNRARLGREPAPWLRALLNVEFTVVDDPPDWDFRKTAVRDTYQFFGKFLTQHQRERGYRANRVFPLRDLPYFDKNDPNFGGRCLDLARMLVTFASQDMQYAPGYSFGGAVDLFADIFRKGELRFCDVAMTLNSILEYGERIS